MSVAIADPPACVSCGALLSRYRSTGAVRCALCERSAAELDQGDAELLDPESLALAVAGVLLLGAARRPDERVYVQTELDRLGILADHIDVHAAVNKLRRRYGWRVEAVEGLPGYRLRRWPFRFRRRRRTGQLTLFGRGA